MHAQRHSAPPLAREDSLITIANLIAGWVNTPWCLTNPGMEYALPLIATAAQHAHHAISGFERGDIVAATAHSAAAGQSYKSASGYHKDIEGYSDFLPLGYAIEELLKAELSTAKQQAEKFITSMNEYEQRMVSPVTAESKLTQTDGSSGPDIAVKGPAVSRETIQLLGKVVQLFGEYLKQNDFCSSTEGRSHFRQPEGMSAMVRELKTPENLTNPQLPQELRLKFAAIDPMNPDKSVVAIQEALVIASALSGSSYESAEK